MILNPEKLETLGRGNLEEKISLTIPGDIWREIIFWCGYLELWIPVSTTASLRHMVNLIRTCKLFREAVYLRWNPLHFLMSTSEICPQSLPLRHVSRSIDLVRGLMRFKAVKAEPYIFAGIIASWIKLGYRGTPPRWRNPPFFSSSDLM